MRKNRAFFQKKWIVTAGIVLAFFIFISLLFNQAAYILVRTDPPEKTDAAIILMGSLADRLLRAADLYEAGLVKQILMVNEKQSGIDSLKKRNVQVPSLANLSKQALIDLGVPDSLITILPGQAASTCAEADSLAKYLLHTPKIKSITLVSSAYHLCRAALIFEDAFRDNNLNVKLCTADNKYTSFQTEKWYSHRESAKNVFNEYTKLIWFLVVEKWQ